MAEMLEKLNLGGADRGGKNALGCTHLKFLTHANFGSGGSYPVTIEECRKRGKSYGFQKHNLMIRQGDKIAF